MEAQKEVTQMEETKMRCMVIVKANKESEAGVLRKPGDTHSHG